MDPVCRLRSTKSLTHSHPNREGQGFVLVYSIASRVSFERIEIFRQSMNRIKRGNPVFLLVGNKCDKSTEREVSYDEGVRLAEKYGCDFMETSARTSQNVENLFTNIVRTLRHRAPGPDPLQSSLGSSAGKPKKRRCIIV